MGLHIICFFQKLHYLLPDGMKVNRNGFPYQILLYVMIAVNQEITHICYLPPLQVAVSLAKLEGKHVGRGRYAALS